MNTYIQAAFDEICKDSVNPEEWYVCLIEDQPFYGGPEEGGWWGNDATVVAYQIFPNEELAKAAKIQIDKLAYELAKDAQKEYGNQCLRETAWLDARGLDDSFLREPDGPSKYRVIVSNEIPTNSRGDRQYS